MIKREFWDGSMWKKGRNLGKKGFQGASPPFFQKLISCIKFKHKRFMSNRDEAAKLKTQDAASKQKSGR